MSIRADSACVAVGLPVFPTIRYADPFEVELRCRSNPERPLGGDDVHAHRRVDVAHVGDRVHPGPRERGEDVVDGAGEDSKSQGRSREVEQDVDVAVPPRADTRQLSR